ncbi:hypothetical protein [Hyalangium minutum]|uniref:Uncharacterized protein n=1 Tax=Hyalangium minutum TaxID=394096 RepID=A0A085WK48_9BACT|nr:hypothetical protein [Hyalangium minutum]KFE68061.1 hypothetical protein DB31_7298 [Hyalangium minutum]
MPVMEAKWGIAQEVQQGIEAGQLYLEGGVIRDGKTGRIIQLIREARVDQDTLAECLRPLVPLVLHEALDSRMLSAESQLRALSQEIVQRSVQRPVTAAPLDMLLLGQLLSAVQLVKMHFAAREAERATGLWTELYRSVVQLIAVAEALLSQSDVMRKQVGLWTAYTRLCWGAGVLTLDLVIRRGYASYADMVSGQLVEKAETFERRLDELFSRPSSLSWLSMEHREALQELREVKRRLLARRDALANGFFGQLRSYRESPVDSHPVSAFGTGRPSTGQPPLV